MTLCAYILAHFWLLLYVKLCQVNISTLPVTFYAPSYHEKRRPLFPNLNQILACSAVVSTLLNGRFSSEPV